MVRPKNGIKEKRPSFFKVIIPGYSTRYLRIPPPFLELISNDLSGEATLNSNTCSEWSWNVGVTKTIRSVYFKDGWQEFLKDNSVEDGDFVVFEYEGNMNFNVQIFDNSGCERDCFPNIGTPKISSFAEKKRHPSTPRKSDICCSKCHLQLNSRKDSSDNIAKQRLPGRPRKSHIGCSKRHPCPSNFRKVSAESFKSNYPHVTLAIKKTYCVYSFPTSFYKEHLSPGNYEVVFLKIAEGKKWYKVKLVRSIATAFMSKGWSKFARANQIKVGNVCAFEVVEENKLVVHIIQD
ncbi:PREDICTED: B3 domain-containing protein Os01g0723500-like isoform X1 [Fragaria vesca subsp. vesca]|uniref:B3 domain-containing protein Os01g0723500-like isoform X1 n=1 Tax=Fragaria vesca subsp. vesca TaxID=101020 RepID=UPI0002C2DE8B|nr:PREDICTED: B3 domain-containing protein Os01g0723500-like isoform X1 [Fragaria vesca subsp. vesca]XP_011458369.1 PREDICTED: B3 domain-containing protein Os01g0723500-like isoform X1 [Fragaria vesca subsp. vesca]XP_011458370.1 PREDICTED: B3 domain-containing protein Os01g0723500-like isoform X1 [Fragaria vesca subsp. vesca]XP_011458371.1 PREDICTED: B3 domain-containing protein Os01g0723500-like isoform X1 [Fragaria vesca subsp. vesca]